MPTTRTRLRQAAPAKIAQPTLQHQKMVRLLRVLAVVALNPTTEGSAAGWPRTRPPPTLQEGICSEM